MEGSERRTAQRIQVELKATIEGSGGHEALGAIVRDISTGGARLEGANFASAPEQFDLTITTEAGKTETRRARLVWRGEGAVGVNFGDYIGA